MRWPVFSCQFTNDAFYWYVYYRYFCFVLKKLVSTVCVIACACACMVWIVKKNQPRLHVRNSNNNTEHRKLFIFLLLFVPFLECRSMASSSCRMDSTIGWFLLFASVVYLPKPKNRFHSERKKKNNKRYKTQKIYKKSNFSSRTTRDIVFQRWSIHTCLRRTVLGMRKAVGGSCWRKKKFPLFRFELKSFLRSTMSFVQCVHVQSLVRSKILLPN